MVASASTGSSFAGLAGYLGGGEERVGWVETRGVFADDVPGAVAEMREQAALSARCEKPVYHVTIAFDPSDNPTDAEVREAVDRTLRDVGLGEHQALVVRHVDREHAHVHVMVNRVGPDGRAWSTSNDRQRLRASVEQQERELGVRWTGRNARAAGIERDTDRGFARDVRDRALSDFKEARAWADLEARLRAKGLRVERRGRGAVVTDGTREAKLSSVSRTVSRSRLEERLGRLTAHERARGGRDQVERGARPETRSRPAPHRGGGALRRAGSYARRGGRVMVDGSTRDADETLARAGLSAAPQALARVATPGVATPGRSASSSTARTAALRAHGRDARHGGRLGRTEEAIREHVRTARLVAERNKTLRAVARVEARASEAAASAQTGLRRAQTVEAGARHSFGSAAAQTYAEPTRAARAFLDDAASRGADHATGRMAAEPERYGALKPTTTRKPFGLGRRTTTEAARDAAPHAARQGRAYVDAQQSVARAEAEAKRAVEVQRSVSTELSGVRKAVQESGPHELGPSAVRARLDRLDQALRERQRPALAPERLKGPAAEALIARVGSAGMSVAKTAAKAASKSLGRGE